MKKFNECYVTREQARDFKFPYHNDEAALASIGINLFLGELLRQIRRASGYSLSNLSDLTGIGLLKLRSIEEGTASLDLKELYSITKPLQVDPTELLCFVQLSMRGLKE